MKTNNRLIIVVAVLIIAVIAIAIALNYTRKNQENMGGQKDEHGCLIGAGYSYDKEIGACTRSWELDENQKKAAKIAVVPLSFPVTVVEVNKLDCEGCYNIKLQRNDNQEQIERELNNWQIKTSEERNYCTPEQKKAAVCTMEYHAVCGWFDQNIQCFKYPCAAIYSNPCMACSDDKVAYWTEGECPK